MKPRILISVTDKTGLEKFAKLTTQGWKIISTGGTAKALEGMGIPCVLVENETQFPEMLDGRLKTLHPRIFGGILANRSKVGHMEAIAEYNIATIDLVVVNLYDFLGNPDIETIDIGGPSLIRAAAKNCASVPILTDPRDYDEVIAHLFATGEVPEEKRVALALKAFEYTAAHDAAISKWLRDKVRLGESIFQPGDTGH